MEYEIILPEIIGDEWHNIGIEKILSFTRQSFFKKLQNNKERR
jgi:hypothetical protein